MSTERSFELGDITAVLAPRHPRVLVDRVTRCEPGTVIETVKAVSAAEACYADLPAGLAEDAYHYPESLILDSFAQSAALLWAATSFDGSVPIMAGTRGVTFHQPVLPGSLLRMVVRLIPGTASTMFFTGRGSLVDGPLVLTVDNLVLTTRRNNAVLHASAG